MLIHSQERLLVILRDDNTAIYRSPLGDIYVFVSCGMYRFVTADDTEACVRACVVNRLFVYVRVRGVRNTSVARHSHISSLFSCAPFERHLTT